MQCGRSPWRARRGKGWRSALRPRISFAPPGQRDGRVKLSKTRRRDIAGPKVYKFAPSQTWRTGMRKTLPVVLSLLISQAAFAEVVVLQGATLIDGTGRPPLKNAVLILDAGRISAVGPADKVKAPPGARALDLKGRTIIPGLINAHGHVGLVVGGQSRADGYTREN